MKPTLALLLLIAVLPKSHSGEFQAGAAVVDVSPKTFPVLINGGMLSRTATQVTSPVKARAIVVADGSSRLAIVVVDSCMMPRPLLDEAKKLAADQTGIPPDHILISATHTHSAPSALSCLGTEQDTNYTPLLRGGIVDAIARAAERLEPAEAGWGSVDCHEFTALRRWIRRPDRIETDPFGNATVRANMHAASNPANVVGESGPEDPDLTMIAFRATNGRPIAVLANFSMHYYSGEKPVGPDYFGMFCEGFASRVSGRRKKESDSAIPDFVAVLSHGCSGDIWRRDYRQPPEERDPWDSMQEYADQLTGRAFDEYRKIEYSSDADVEMQESRMTLKYRVADAQRLEWAQRVIDGIEGGVPKNRTEVYAAEQLILAKRKSTEIVVQALRIGDMAIATTPNETYAITGLKLKLQSPLPRTMVIELANGGDGYIPPPEQHLLGGYNTWAARSAGLEIQAEPKIVGTALNLLQNVSGRSRRVYRQSRGGLSDAILKSRPVAWWRLDELQGEVAEDSSGGNRHAALEPSVAYFLKGPERVCASHETNRCVHFAGGRLQTDVLNKSNRWTVAVWIWNGMPLDARATTGWFFSHGHSDVVGRNSIHVGLGGTASRPGHLVGQIGDGLDVAVGSSHLPRWTWHHVAIVCRGRLLDVFLNGAREPEMSIELTSATAQPGILSFLGGRCDNDSNWEGRLDEIAVFDRCLSSEEIASLTGSADRSAN